MGFNHQTAIPPSPEQHQSPWHHPHIYNPRMPIVGRKQTETESPESSQTSQPGMHSSRNKKDPATKYHRHWKFLTNTHCEGDTFCHKCSLVVLGTEPKALCMLGRYSTTELHPQFQTRAGVLNLQVVTRIRKWPMSFYRSFLRPSAHQIFTVRFIIVVKLLYFIEVIIIITSLL